jgi:hypothetical protein
LKALGLALMIIAGLIGKRHFTAGATLPYRGSGSVQYMFCDPNIL